MIRILAVTLMVSSSILGACQAPAAKPAPKDDKTAVEPPPSAEKWRPAWWSDKPLREGGRISVCAMGENQDLLGARRNAIALATRVLAEARGGLAPADDAATRTDSIRLSDGTFRAFVRLTATEE